MAYIHEFQKFLSENGIKRQLTVPYTLQQNGVAERANRTLVEMARSMIIHSGVNESLWGEAVRTAAYLRNRSETRSLKSQTPFELWTGKKPSISHLKIFGCKPIALNKKHAGKFKPKGIECMMIGYSTTAKAYRLMRIGSNQVIESRDVVFLGETIGYPKNGNSENETALIDEIGVDCSQILAVDNNKEDAEVLEEEQIDSEINEADSSDVYESAKSDDTEEREIHGPGRPKKIKTGKPGRPRKQYNLLNMMKVQDVKIPVTFAEATQSEMSQEWVASIQKEIDALEANQTWELQDLPEGKKAIGSKWVFDIKGDKDGNVMRFKSRLVAKGCAQQYGIDFFETFSSIVRYSSVRLIISLAVEHNLFLHQMDVSTAYLNSELSEEVYMKQPDGFDNKQAQ